MQDQRDTGLALHARAKLCLSIPLDLLSLVCTMEKEGDCNPYTHVRVLRFYAGIPNNVRSYHRGTTSATKACRISSEPYLIAKRPYPVALQLLLPLDDRQTDLMI
jgi:hypothetical protein